MNLHSQGTAWMKTICEQGYTISPNIREITQTSYCHRCYLAQSLLSHSETAQAHHLDPYSSHRQAHSSHKTPDSFRHREHWHSSLPGPPNQSPNSPTSSQHPFLGIPDAHHKHTNPNTRRVHQSSTSLHHPRHFRGMPSWMDRLLYSDTSTEIIDDTGE